MKTRTRSGMALLAGGALALAGLGAWSVGVGQDAEGFLEADVASRVSRARADLRTIHTALESYRVDYRVLPETLHQLTSPIAYLTSVPLDPFAGPPYSELAEDTPHEALLYRTEIDDDFRYMLVYSIGPDGIDDRARIEYDPAQGAISPGDIVRRVELGDYILGLDPDTLARVNRQREDVRSLARNVRYWAEEHGRMPADWEDVRALDPSFPIPDDIFAPGRKLLYTYDAPIARVYGRGPNGEDNGGLVDLRGNLGFDEERKGDIVELLDWEEISARIEARKNPTVENTEDEYLRILLQLRDETGRDNALIYYQMAAWHFAGAPEQTEDDLMRRIQRDGWTSEGERLGPYLRAWQPALDLVRQGAARNDAYGIGYSMGPQTLLPNFFAIQVSARVLAVEARRFAYEGDHDLALDNYRTALRMARDMASEGNTLISGLIGISIESITHTPLRAHVTSGDLDAAQLARLQEFLAYIDESHPGIAHALRGEFETMEVALINESARIMEISEEDFKRESADFLREIEEGLGIKLTTQQEVVELIELTRSELEAYWQKAVEHASRELYKGGNFDGDALIAQMKSPIARQAIPNLDEVAVRQGVTVARRRLALTETGLELYRLGHGNYPESLDVIDGATISRLPIDPFSGSPMRYRVNDDGAAFTLYSLGPDRVESSPSVTYDPTNGTLSAGNIY